jgi:hypothetical protein
MRWYGEQFKHFAAAQCEKGLDAMAAELHRISVVKAGIRNQGVQVPVKRVRKGGNATSRTIYPHSSKPGESPRRRTGAGQKGIVWGRQGLTARVGYTRAVRYMTFHELGIRYKRGLQKRPTIVPAMNDNRTKLERLFENAAKRAAK